MICPFCGLLMGNTAQNVFECPQGHYKMWVTLTFSSSTTTFLPLTLSATLLRNWEDEPVKTPVPQEFYQAFQDVEVIEP